MPTSLKILPRRGFIKQDGTTALYLRLTIDRKSKTYQLGFYVNLEKWDWNKGILKGTSPYVGQFNTYILNELSKANNFIFQIQNSDRVLTHEEFEKLWFDKSVKDYYDFVNEYVGKNKGRLAESYLKQLRGEASKLKKFKPVLLFSDINHQFLSEYEYYMRNNLKNSTNTVYKTFKRMKTIINEALKTDEKIMKKNPFLNYKLKTEPTNRLFLTKNEFDNIYSLKDQLPEKMKNVMRYFLFSCLTGLRYQDIKDLKFSHIVDDKYIDIAMSKTGERVVIPLLKKAQELLPEKQGHDEHVFYVLSNQKTNDYLKIGIEKAGIRKNISFHCARHTFATMALNNGIPLEVVQKLLGHSMIRTTQIYGKIVNETIFEQMKKMDL